MIQPATTAAAEAVARRLVALDQMELEALRGEWRRVITTTPSLRLSADLLRRTVAFRLQEAALGGLRADVTRQLTIAQRRASPVRPGANMKAGTTLIRDWHGRTHTIRVVEGGFEYEGIRYASLTKIAREITGAAWSGPRFFGLVKVRAKRGLNTPQADA